MQMKVTSMRGMKLIWIWVWRTSPKWLSVLYLCIK